MTYDMNFTMFFPSGYTDIARRMQQEAQWVESRTNCLQDWVILGKTVGHVHYTNETRRNWWDWQDLARMGNNTW
jgi:hypothetical protein